MKFLVILTTAVVAATSASALPEPNKPPQGCKPATYSCTLGNHGQQGWQVCDVSHKWVYAGDCPPKTSCYFNDVNQSPYCI